MGASLTERRWEPLALLVIPAELGSARCCSPAVLLSAGASGGDIWPKLTPLTPSVSRLICWVVGWTATGLPFDMKSCPVGAGGWVGKAAFPCLGAGWGGARGCICGQEGGGENLGSHSFPVKDRMFPALPDAGSGRTLRASVQEQGTCQLGNCPVEVWDAGPAH